MSNSTPVSTLIETLLLLENSLDLKTASQHLFGSLIYIMLGTKGDIVYTVYIASRCLVNPGP